MIKELCKVISIIEEINKNLPKQLIPKKEIQDNKKRVCKLFTKSLELDELLNKLAIIDFTQHSEIETELINLHIKVLFYSSLVAFIGDLTKAMAENYNQNKTS